MTARFPAAPERLFRGRSHGPLSDALRWSMRYHRAMSSHQV